MKLFEYLVQRQTSDACLPNTVVEDLTSRHIPLLWKPTAISTGETDKIFASKWLDDQNVICGTKSNQLLVVNMRTKSNVHIPMLDGSQDGVMPAVSAGIHDIKINQSKTLLATSGNNPNHLAIYKLPTFDPVCVGEVHTDWVFAVEWIDDTLMATGSRDGSIAVWKIRPDDNTGASSPTDRSHTRLPIVSQHSLMTSELQVDRIRDLAYNDCTGHLAALSPLAFVHVWDIATKTQIESVSLPFCHENVCLSLNKDQSLYVVGSQSHVSFLDVRTSQAVRNVMTNDIGAGVRSVSFKDALVTIGTGHGSVFFYDTRANKFLENSDKGIYSLDSGKGWLHGAHYQERTYVMGSAHSTVDDVAIYSREVLRLDNTLSDYFSYTDHETECFRNAIYTHCYDPTGTKLFTAGGPLALVLYGNYAALWD